MRFLATALMTFALMTPAAAQVQWYMVGKVYSFSPVGSLTAPSEPVTGEVMFGPYADATACEAALGLLWLQPRFGNAPVWECVTR